MAAQCAQCLAHGLAWHRGPPLGQSSSWGSQENVKIAGFGSIVAFTKGSSLSPQIPFDILLVFDKSKSPGCHPPHCFSFLSLLCFCVLTHEPKLAQGWWDLCGKGQGGMGGVRKPFQEQPTFLVASHLNSQTRLWTLPLFPALLQKIHIYKKIMSFI